MFLHSVSLGKTFSIGDFRTMYIQNGMNFEKLQSLTVMFLSVGINFPKICSKLRATIWLVSQKVGAAGRLVVRLDHKSTLRSSLVAFVQQQINIIIKSLNCCNVSENILYGQYKFKFNQF